MLKDLPLEKQTRVLWLHNQAFGGDSACKQCPGNCCTHCAGAKGYRHDWKPGEKEKFGFDAKTGFKGETGCKLPLTERSPTCLCFSCGGVNENWDNPVFAPPKGVNRPFSKERRESMHRMNNILWGQEEERNINLY